MAGCLAILVLAVWLTPDPRGYGTHRRLGFGKCGMLVTTGFPCPTCGMTTAFSYTVRGRLFKAFMAQPAGMALALATIATALGSGYVLISARMPRVPIPIMTPYALFITLLVILVGSWAFKIIVGLIDGTFPDRG